MLGKALRLPGSDIRFDIVPEVYLNSILGLVCWARNPKCHFHPISTPTLPRVTHRVTHMSVPPPPSAATTTRDLVSSLLSDVTASATASLQPLADEALLDLFQSLDQNKDGTISFEEFKGTSVSSWAALFAVSQSMPSVSDALQRVGAYPLLPDFPPPNAPLSSWISTWLYCLFLFQIFLYVTEHIRFHLNLRCLPERGRFPKEPLKVTPLHVSNQEAVPWHDTPQDTCYNRFKVIVMVGSGLAPLRLIQGVTLFLLAVICLNMSNVVPLKLWRRFWLSIVRLQVYGMLASLGYYKISMKGTFASPDKGEERTENV